MKPGDGASHSAPLPDDTATERAGERRLMDALEQKRMILIDRLSAIPETQLTIRPRRDAWSRRDVAEHLMRSEKATLDSIIRREGREPLQRRWHHALTRRVIAAALDSRFRIPVTGRVLMPAGLALADIARSWAGVHDAWRRYLAGLSGDRLNQPVFRHPLGVTMSAAETLVFLARHHDHHLHQIARIERAIADRL